MRLLFISAFYPPYEIGGWEQWTRELVDRLKIRGHDIHVLTSNFGLCQSKPTDDSVLRVLELINDQHRYDPWNFLLRRKSNQNHNFITLKETLHKFQPQAVMVHTMWNFSHSIPWMVERLLPGCIAYYLSDYWPAEPDIDESFWINQGKRQSIFGWRSFLSHKILNQLKREQEDHRLKFENTIFVSEAVKKSMINSGFEWATRGCVIYNGIDVTKFSPAKHGSLKNSNDYLLFVGSLAPHKGLKTVLEALALVNETPGLNGLILQIAGGGHPYHTRQIESQIKELNLANRVKILGRINRDLLPDLYRQAFALIFPSIWQEPLALTTQEAMACGTPVIATLTGGTSELIVNGCNALAFKPGDAGDLATQIIRLWSDPELARRLGQAGRETIEKKFDIELTVSHFEDYLAELSEHPT